MKIINFTGAELIIRTPEVDRMGLIEVTNLRVDIFYHGVDEFGLEVDKFGYQPL